MYAQITLQKEGIVNGKYRLVYSNEGYSYSVIERNGKRYLSFSHGNDEKTSQSLPTRNLIIAIPPNSRPAITVTITKQRQVSPAKIEHQPGLDKQLYSVKGYFWIDDCYCVRIVVNPFSYDMARGLVNEMKEFYVDIAIPQSAVASVSTVNFSPSHVIDNPKFGSQWKSKRSSFPVVQSDSWIDYTADYVKLGVANDGIYRLRYDDLLAYGVPVASLNPHSFKIYLMGKEIPIYVHGESDNTFVEGDYIEFLGRRNYGDVRYREAAPYGSPYYEYLNPYSDTTIYWLNWSGSFGQRIDTVVAVNGTPTDTLQYYDDLLHMERNLYWESNDAGGDIRENDPAILENETWCEGQLGVGELSIPFSVSDLYSGKPARAFVKLQDYASDIQTNAHDLALSINNTSTIYDSGFIDKYQVKVLGANFSSSVLSNGTNTVDIHSFATANSINTVERDWYELEYPRYLKPINDSLNFAYNNTSVSSLAAFSITGLSANTFSLYKFALKDSSVVKITNYQQHVDTLTFVDTVANGRYYFLLREDKVPAPIFFYKKKFTNLRSSANKADYIAITHPYFQSAASNYVSFIASAYGVTAKLVNIFDIYDEYNYGFFAPEPIREFLKSTHDYWQAPAPQYVVLIGKGTYDFYGNKTRYFGVPPTPNFVPPYGNPVSDIWFVQWDSTGSLIPQMNIGRIPAKNIDEFQFYVTKHQNYVSQSFDDWNKRYLFFAGGDATDSSQIAQCKGVNDFIINNYVLKAPIGGLAFDFYKTTTPVTNFGPYSAGYVNDAIDQGGVFISYIGHSGTQTWDNGITDISQLANTRNRYPMVTDFGCSTGKFAEPDVVSFSELAVNGLQGQAISYFGNSSIGFTTTAFSFPQVFYKKLLIDTSASVGDVHRLAKIDYIKQFGSSDEYGLFIKTNTLIGDPIVKLPIPTKPNFSFTNSIVIASPQLPTDQTDSVTISLNYFNLGSVVGDTVEFLATDSYQGNIILSRTIKRPVPLFSDSLLIAIPARGKPGEHNVTFTADPLNKINEIYKNDNSIVYQLLVASSSIRNLALSPLSNQIHSTIQFLNPSIKPSQPFFLVDISENNLFAPKTSFQVPYDTFATTFRIDTSYYGKRIWLRTKFDVSSSVGLTYSFISGDKENYFIGDSTAFSELQISGVNFFGTKIVLDTTKTTLNAISAGFNDGNTAVISKNGQDYIPVSTTRGFHVCIFDASTYEFKWYYLFDVQDSLSVSATFKNFLDTLSTRFLVVIAIANDVASNGSFFPASLKMAIQQYGSNYIDSVGVGDSWALIGRKGAIPGTVPEGYEKRYNGHPVSIDTTILTPNTQGKFVTQSIGPVAGWKNVGLHFKENIPGDISMKVVGISTNNFVDTLKQWSSVDSVLDISTINAQQYPYIQLIGTLQRGVTEPSPSLSSIEVNYNALPELGTNYQTVNGFVYKNGNQLKQLLPGDSLLQGEIVDIVFRVYNVGGVTAKNVGVVVQSVWDNNTTEQIAKISIDSIGIHSYKEVSTSYNTSLGFGGRNLIIKIDPDSLIREIFKDNNYFAIPFVVLRDSIAPQLLDVLFDGTTIQNGDYVSAAPTIDIVVHDQGALSIIDTTTASLTLDETPVFYNLNQSLSILQGNTPEDLTVRFKPMLAGGNHQLGLRIKNRSGNTADSTEHITTFVVDPQLKVEELFNIPNPFPRQTCFTFKLTQVPEELQIKIYTVAGRLIKTIELNSAQLEYGFNKVYWDGRDGDGDEIANGVYLYRLIAKGKGQQAAVTQKLVKMR